jgi:hypothetical protein
VLQLPRWWLILLISAEGLLAAFDATLTVQCHHSGSECWPFFFAFTLNLPVSIPLSDLLSQLPDWLKLDRFGDAFTLVTALVYFLGGTLWWLAISVVIRAAVLAGRAV